MAHRDVPSKSAAAGRAAVLMVRPLARFCDGADVGFLCQADLPRLRACTRAGDVCRSLLLKCEQLTGKYFWLLFP
jgi:hypothetical protein